MKPKSDGSLEKLAEKAADEASVFIHTTLKILPDQNGLKQIILSALSEATAALEEEIEGLKKANRGLYLESNQRLERIEELELANATTRFPQPSGEVKEPATPLAEWTVTGEEPYKVYAMLNRNGKSWFTLPAHQCIQIAKAHNEDLEASARTKQRACEEEVKTPTPVLQVSEEAGDEPLWIVNDNGELGVMIHRRAFFLYKGDNIEYRTGKHDNGVSMLFRRVGKLEFGETCKPAAFFEKGWNTKDYYLEPCIAVPGLSDPDPHGLYEWMPLTIIKGVEKVGDKQPRTMAQKKN